MNTRDALTRLAADHPDICIDGLQPIYPGDDTHTVAELIEEVERWPFHLETCQKWFAACPVIKTVRQVQDTYSYKGEIEDWSDMPWIPHIAVLVAATQAGLDMIPNPHRPHAGLLPLGARRPGASGLW